MKPKKQTARAGGGRGNTVSGTCSVLVGGAQNTSTGSKAEVRGGTGNTCSSTGCAVVLGGAK